MAHLEMHATSPRPVPTTPPVLLPGGTPATPSSPPCKASSPPPVVDSTHVPLPIPSPAPPVNPPRFSPLGPSKVNPPHIPSSALSPVPSMHSPRFSPLYVPPSALPNHWSPIPCQTWSPSRVLECPSNMPIFQQDLENMILDKFASRDGIREL
ncbi:hypothetical protein BT96DRAFT_1005495 [Gymnopus androsaceus JB14]|uniref:Uncharacterized protein n=1 Tax=Gymnopus androsaceus JB14 TaxID=1447944 RepID=A0A6A4GMU0_9AGAR|nr:hypothetical protein BT96DRAFT_1005495 [Gymnopus androsaceus JB14]